MSLNLTRKNESQNLLENPEFKAKWMDLHGKCPWASLFQDVRYLEIWNRHYKNVAEFIIVYEMNKDGDLTGLFPLSRCRTTGKLSLAGDYHSEYDSWLALRENGDSFINKALLKLGEEFPDKRLQMMFIAPGSPMKWVEGKWADQIILKKMPRPLVALDEHNRSAESLRKKGNKTRIRQLKRFGELKYKALLSPADLSEVFDEIEDYSRLRISALHNNQLEKDENRKPFHIDLMNETDFVYPTLLKVDDKIASAQICFQNRDEMLLCGTSMSPFFAKQSPSKIHLLMLGEELSKTSFKNFDLSPGNGYKQRFATRTEKCDSVTIFFSKSDFFRYKTKRRLVKTGQGALEKLSITKTRAFKLADKVRHKLRRVKLRTIPGTILKNIGLRIYDSKECRMYSFDLQSLGSLEDPKQMNVDSVSDLLKYKPVEGWQDTPSQFHQKVLRNFEQGIHSYTCVENGKLLHYGWLVERQEISQVTEVGQEFTLPANTAVLFDYYTDPEGRGRGLYQNSLIQGLHDAARIPGTERIFIGVLADNAASRYVIEKLGFKYEGSLFKKTVLGRISKWQNWYPKSQIKEETLNLEESYST
ncbi:MAG: GNAT family N-acetyltransferase [Pyrinomonadaceae bacterium]|nr:GNAT family N-acetyltransferase [Pyrinomonadaceae bacterium]